MQRFSSSPSLGALSFSHRTLLLDPPLAGNDFTFEALDFMGISNAEEANVTGPPKYSELRQWICCQRTRSESSMMDSCQKISQQRRVFFCTIATPILARRIAHLWTFSPSKSTSTKFAKR
ncbi:hypothetical protein GCK32_018085 [Trichostrongylus colubriformis]|uniref:Uncharacterized protein n=1 Tax=Trichostrongylus colubriformis TaxID=6319 RepID=A0AAN8ETT6_TRICO